MRERGQFSELILTLFFSNFVVFSKRFGRTSIHTPDSISPSIFPWTSRLAANVLLSSHPITLSRVHWEHLSSNIIHSKRAYKSQQWIISQLVLQFSGRALKLLSDAFYVLERLLASIVCKLIRYLMLCSPAGVVISRITMSGGK